MKCSCGKEMVVRQRRSDGNKFWGCTGFPKCRKTKPYVEQKKFGPIVQKSKLPKPDEKYQKPVIDAFQSGESLLVKACAGSGKTTLLRMLAEVLPKDKRIAYLVFNTDLKDEAAQVLPPHVSVMTTHQLGFAAIRAYNGNTRTLVKSDKVRNFVVEQLRPTWDLDKGLVQPIVNLVGKVKNTVTEPTDENLERLSSFYGIIGTNPKVFELTRKALKYSEQSKEIDFDDMLYLPVKLGLPFEKFDIILADEVQDFNQAQLEGLKMALADGGQIIGVGDEDQSMYGFRGAQLDAMNQMKDFFSCKPMPLSITYRCPKSVVSLVNQVFPEIPFEPSPFAIEGEVAFESSVEYLNRVKPGDMVLCRTNAPLVVPVLTLLSRGVKAIIKGRNVGTQILNLVERFDKPGNTLSETLYGLTKFKDQEVSKLLLLNKDLEADILTDTVNTIYALSQGCETTVQVKERIKSIFTDTVEGVVFSSIHKAKGLEADNVYILHPELLPHPRASQPWEHTQETHIAYVAVTRAKKRLVFIDGFLALDHSYEHEVELVPETKVKEQPKVNVQPEPAVPAKAQIPVIDDCPF